MNSNRNIAILVGAFFIIADIGLFAGEAFYKPILNAPDYLENAYPNKLKIIIGILIEFVGYIGLVFIPILLFPYLKKHSEALAFGYMAFRLFEVVLLTLAQVNKLSLINLSENYLNKGSENTTYFQNMGDAIHSQIHWINSDGLIYISVFVIGGLMFYSVLYQSKLLPRWIAVWGLIADVALIIASLMATFDLYLVLATVLILPIALQEIFMAIWLMVKGFNESALATASVKTDLNK